MGNVEGQRIMTHTAPKTQTACDGTVRYVAQRRWIFFSQATIMCEKCTLRTVVRSWFRWPWQR